MVFQLIGLSSKMETGGEGDLEAGALCASWGEAAKAHALAIRHTPTNTDFTCLVTLKSIHVNATSGLAEWQRKPQAGADLRVLHMSAISPRPAVASGTTKQRLAPAWVDGVPQRPLAI